MLNWMLAKTLRLALCGGAMGLLATGCASEMMEGDGTFAPDHGGQTGSLKPTCEQESDTPFMVPEGRTALVQGWNELSNPVLTDSAGNVIATSITRDDEAALVQTAETLPAGDYTLTYDCGDAGAPVQRDISVAEAAPLPTTFGGLELMPPDKLLGCSELEFVTLKWAPPPEFLPYLDLVQLTFTIDGAEFGSVPLFDSLTADVNGDVLVAIPNCAHFAGTCGVTDGTYALSARIAGRPGLWASPEVVVEGLCFRELERTERDEIGCALGYPGRTSYAGLGWFTFIGCVVLRRANGRPRKASES